MKLHLISSYINNAICLTLAALVSFSTPVFAQYDGLASIEKGLDIISKFATNLCSNPSLKRESTTIEVSGAVKAELAGLLRKLASVGISTGVKYQSKESFGLLETDLLQSLRDTNNCRLQVFHSLKERVIDQAMPSSVDTKAGRSGSSSEATYGNTRCVATASADGASANCKKGN